MTLRTKILGAFSLIVLLSLGSFLLLGIKTFRSRFGEFDRARDRGRARTLAPLLEEGVKTALENPESENPKANPRTDGPFAFQNRDSPASPPGGAPPLSRPPSRMGPMQGMTRRAPRNFLPNDWGEALVITDLQGRVLLNASDYKKSRISQELSPGVPILVEGKPAGYLYVGGMIPRKDSPLGERLFFRSLFRAAMVQSLLIFMAALMLGVILSTHILRPVKRLRQAVLQVGKGNLGTRVPGTRKDELGELGKGFNTMAGALEESENQRRRLIADTAHELRTPVSLIQTRVEMMEEGIYPLDKEGLAALAGEAGRLTRLVEELGALADLESSGTETRREVLSVDALLGETLDAARPEGDRRNLRLSRESALGLYLLGDQGKLRQVFANLLTNALRHAASRVLLTAEKTPGGASPGSVTLRVEDDGPGIPPGERERVFQRFYRLDSSRSRSTGGSGLGLAICRRMVLDHQGEIRAEESAALGGAALVVVIPAAPPEEDEAPPS